VPYKIVGISGSPIKEGNTDTFLSTIMDNAEEAIDTMFEVRTFFSH